MSFLTVLIITIERAVLPDEPPRDPTGKFYIFRRSSGEIVFTSRVEEGPELLKPELPTPRQRSTAMFLGGEFSLLSLRMCLIL